MTATDCLICAMEEAEESATVFRDPLWACEIIPGFDVPGWFVLRVRRHAERLTGLDEEELAVFGRRARDLVGAVSEVTGAAATYLLVFGERNPHFHVLVAARGEDVPEDRRNGDILRLRAERADPVAAARLVPAVREAYLRLSREALPAASG
ncbi:hypothetical protein [Nocardiopsis protaetiae]|uniref:hypothetical protein n=1 Tax=Nocardiopsis protaetiae TaxID=3382270 RepID=UPI00387AE7AD